MRSREHRWTGPGHVALVVVLIVSTFWLLTVRFNRGGKWTALWCIGNVHAVPPPLDGPQLFRFPDAGFDGQFYRTIAHDPWFKRGFAAYVDAPRLRYRRILLPGLAHVLALGRDAAIDPVYGLLVLGSVALGAGALAAYALSVGVSPWWGLSFLLFPATVASIDRLVADATLLALLTLLALPAASLRSRSCFLLLTLCPLVRETGLILTVAWVVAALAAGRWRRAAWWALTPLPALAWYVFVQTRTAAYSYGASFVPLSGIVKALVMPRPYAGKPWLVARVDQFTDAVALLGFLLAVFLAYRYLLPRWREPLPLTGVLFATLGIFLQRPDHWFHVLDFGRVYSPLFLVLVLEALRTGRRLLWLPLILLLPRMQMQLASQAVGIVQGLLGLHRPQVSAAPGGGELQGV